MTVKVQHHEHLQVYSFNHPAFEPKYRTQARSVALLIESSALTEQPNGKFTFNQPLKLKDKLLRHHNHPYGEHEPFGEEVSLYGGSAFLIDPLHALTAAHCVCLNGTEVLRNIETIRLVFGFKTTNHGSATKPLKAIYSIKQVVAHRYHHDKCKGWEDWALLELDRPVEGRIPLELNWYDDVQTDTEASAESICYMLGHPAALPIKITLNGVIKRKHVFSFYTDLDAFAGNSGSPVFCRTTSKVIGILCRGDTDFKVVHGYKGGESRVTVNRVSEANELCQKIKAIGHFVQHYCFAQIYERFARLRLRELSEQPIVHSPIATQDQQFFEFCGKSPKEIQKSIEGTLRNDPKQQYRKYKVKVCDKKVKPHEFGFEGGTENITLTAKKITLSIGTIAQLKNFFRYLIGKRKDAMASHTGLSRIALGNNIANFFANINQDAVAINELNHCYDRGMTITLTVGTYEGIGFIDCKLGKSPLEPEYRLFYYMKNKVSRILRQHRGFTNPALDKAYLLSDISYRIQMACESFHRFAEEIKAVDRLDEGTIERSPALKRQLAYACSSHSRFEAAERELIEEVKRVSAKLKLPIESIAQPKLKWEEVISEPHLIKWIAQMVAAVAIEQTRGVRQDKAAKNVIFHYAEIKEIAKEKTLSGIKSSPSDKKLHPRIKQIFETTYSNLDQLHRSLHMFINTVHGKLPHSVQAVPSEIPSPASSSSSSPLKTCISSSPIPSHQAPSPSPSSHLPGPSTGFDQIINPLSFEYFSGTIERHQTPSASSSFTESLPSSSSSMISPAIKTSFTSPASELARSFLSQVKSMKYRKGDFQEEYENFHRDLWFAQKNKILFLLQKAADRFQAEKKATGENLRPHLTEMVQLSHDSIFKFEDEDRLEDLFKKLMVYVGKTGRNAYGTTFISPRYQSHKEYEDSQRSRTLSPSSNQSTSFPRSYLDVVKGGSSPGIPLPSSSNPSPSDPQPRSERSDSRISAAASPAKITSSTSPAMVFTRSFASQIKSMKFHDEVFTEEFMNFDFSFDTIRKTKIEFLFQQAFHRFNAEKQAAGENPEPHSAEIIQLCVSSFLKDSERQEELFKKLFTYIEQKRRQAYRAQFNVPSTNLSKRF